MIEGVISLLTKLNKPEYVLQSISVQGINLVSFNLCRLSPFVELVDSIETYTVLMAFEIGYLREFRGNLDFDERVIHLYTLTTLGMQRIDNLGDAVERLVEEVRNNG